MGEAMYYCKLFYKTKWAAKDALPVVQDYFRQGAAAYEFWQTNRSQAPSKFWPEFEKQFPEVVRYLASAELRDGDCNNKLAGMLDFGSINDVESSFSLQGREIWYRAEVWHFANWGPMLMWICNHTEADSYGWVSDEYTEPFDLIRRERKIPEKSK